MAQSESLSPEDEATVELLAAKEAYQADQSPENKQRKADAVAAIQEIRQAERADRPGTSVGGDATVTGV